MATEVVVATGYDGRAARDLAATLGVPEVVVFDRVDSTMDRAHALANAGAAPGTIVIADTQEAGRGRAGRRWVSAPGAGVWLTIIERPVDASTLDVLSLRVGLRVAAALDALTSDTVRLKWPNDLVLAGSKLGGILVESRWRSGRPDWVAIGVGINTAPPPSVDRGAALGTSDRVAVIAAIAPAIRSAAAAQGHLSEAELKAYRERDGARGRACSAPRNGRVAGISNDGSLLIQTAEGVERCREGSLVFAGDES